MAAEQPERALLLTRSVWVVLENSTRERMVNIWASSDPKAAAAWIEQLPDRNGRNVGIPPLVRQWFLKSPSAVTAWIESLPDDQSKQIAIDELNGLKEQVE